MTVQRVTLPWAAWHGDSTHELELPAGWRLDTLVPADAPALGDPEIAERLARPVQAPALREIAGAHRSACVVTDDLARPTRMERPVRGVLRELEAGGIARDAITIVVATGTHPVLSRDDLRLKLGTLVDHYRVTSHDAAGSLTDSGVAYGGRPLRLNREFMSADVRVLVGSVIPHPFAGFSAGAKLVIPGLCDADATERTHKFVLMGLRGAAEVGSNPFRAEIEDIVRGVGVHWHVGVVPNLAREPAELVAGDLVRSHRVACLAATRIHETIVERSVDCLVLNAYPKDVDLIQSQNALGAVQRLSPPLVRDGGVIVMATAATRGIGAHGLFAPGGRTYRQPVRNRALGDRSIWLYAPSMREEDARTLHWGGYPFFRTMPMLTAALEEQLGATATAAVMPAACLQWLVDRRGPAPGTAT